MREKEVVVKIVRIELGESSVGKNIAERGKAARIWLVVFFQFITKTIQAVTSGLSERVTMNKGRLVVMEAVPAGTFLAQYTGEVLAKNGPVAQTFVYF